MNSTFLGNRSNMFVLIWSMQRNATTVVCSLRAKEIMTGSCQLDCYSWLCFFGYGLLANNCVSSNLELFKAPSICSHHNNLALHTDGSCPTQLLPFWCSFSPILRQLLSYTAILFHNLCLLRIRIHSVT